MLPMICRKSYRRRRIRLFPRLSVVDEDRKVHRAGRASVVARGHEVRKPDQAAMPRFPVSWLTLTGAAATDLIWSRDATRSRLQGPERRSTIFTG